ncbi:DUF4199 domain-containing protein [Polaribacter sargassicola]|uniref:DUF4199 domain-containing protein n=1 Tax=Polaribacter sargassicola TaxID=2836891 RepID=UPI001F364F49|nr:DUF4199 domain-containing protein [Polaribacter sp. DS7-9]MCG1036352.1 DUF4199 family protein [Polaribacter sp. DS7-9]
MENQANSKSIILNYGLYLGLIGVVTHLVLFATGQLLELNWINSIVSIIAMIVLIVLGIKKYKNDSDGFISWGQGVKIGMGITMVSAVITVVYILLFMNVIEPDFQQQAIEFQKQTWYDAGMTEEQIEAALEMTEKFQTPLISSAMMLGFSAFIGFIISAIVAAIMKKSEEETY